METKKVYQAITAITLAMSKEGISKSRRNTQGSGYNFRGIDDVLNALSGQLAAHQLCIIPRVVHREQVERTSKQGGALFYTAVEVEFDIVSAIDGSVHTARMAGEAMDSSDKSTNKAMSAAYKYMALQLFCIPTEGDNDTENHTHEVQAAVALLNTEQIANIEDLCQKHGRSVEAICKKANTESLKEIAAEFYPAIIEAITKPKATPKTKTETEKEPA